MMSANVEPDKRRIWYESDPNGTVGRIWEADYLPSINLTQDHQRLYYGISKETSDFKHDCPVDPRHETGLETPFLGIELFGSELRPFVPRFDHGFIICTREFEDLCRQSNLTGLAFGPAVTVDCDRTYPSVLSKT